MNQSSITISDVGKTSTLLKSSAAEVQVSSDSEDSGSFLSTLGAIFQSDSESNEETKAVQLNEASTNVDAESIDELIESDGDTELSANDDISNNKQTVTDGEVFAVSDEEISEKSILSAPKSNTTEPDKAAKVMSEGNEFLGRLDDSNQALNSPSGKSLPLQQFEPTKTELKKSSSDLDQYIVQPENAVEEPEPSQSKVVQGGEIIAASAGSEQLQNLQAEDSIKDVAESAEKAFVEKALAEQPVDQEAITGQLNLQPSEMKSSQNTIQSLSDEAGSLAEPTEQIIWDSAKVAGAVAAPSQVIQPSSTAVSSRNEATVLSDSDINQTEGIPTVSAKELSPNFDDLLLDEDQGIETQAQINWSSPIPEQHKSQLDTSKSGSAATLAASGQQNQLSQLNQAALQAQTVAMDKIVQQATPPANNTDFNMAQSQTFNPTPLMSANSTQVNQNLKAALAGGSLLGAAKAMGNDKGDNKDTSLSQQLSGLVSGQGTVQAQVRTEAQQAISQSTLQLSREAAGEKLSEQVQMMMSKNLKNIDIRLDPPELGRMQIRMSINNDMASVQFTVSNPQARDLVEQAMPRLREMLAQQGLQLSDSSVHQQGSGQQQHQYATGNNDSAASENGGSESEDGPNLDEGINLDVNIAEKDDGISFYA